MWHSVPRLGFCIRTVATSVYDSATSTLLNDPSGSHVGPRGVWRSFTICLFALEDLATHGQSIGSHSRPFVWACELGDHFFATGKCMSWQQKSAPSCLSSRQRCADALAASPCAPGPSLTPHPHHDLPLFPLLSSPLCFPLFLLCTPALCSPFLKQHASSPFRGLAVPVVRAGWAG